MYVFKRLHAVRISVVCILCVALLFVAAAASAKPGKGQGSKPDAPAEAGFPASHTPESDPKPGESGYLPQPSVAEPPEGVTDDQLRVKDPAAYGQLVKQRAQVEQQLMAEVHRALGKAGVTSATAQPERAAAAVASTPYSPYGYMWFTLTPNSTSPYRRNGYLGQLYFIYGYYDATVDSYRWYNVSWPALSGNNLPAYQSVVNVGPIPAYDWHVGYMYRAWRGYEPDGRVEFYPGKWRIDPWTGGPYGRSCLEVHGGTGVHEFRATSGCIRLYPSSISALNSYYTYKMANKYDYANAILRVTY